MTSPRFFRYLPPAPDAAEWGGVVLDAGYGTIAPGADYPQPGHPEDHAFSWEKGRRLGAHTFVYITAGRGVFDSELSGEVAVEAGSVFLVFPNVWHRYRPDRETGWSEYWVEVEGPLIESAVRRAGMNAKSPVMRVGHDDALLRCFLNIADTIRREDPGFEAIIGIRSLEIVARIRSLMMIARSTGVTTPEQVVRRAQLSMRENLGGALDFEHLARQLGMSYSKFRRVFKGETGRAPGEYFIEMKINRARQLLMADMGIQETADLLGFDSPHYFSRLFKARAGVTPGSLRPSRSPGNPAP